jgi:hypothetical protein
MDAPGKARRHEERERDWIELDAPDLKAIAAA